jgi:hypothetical protein
VLERELFAEPAEGLVGCFGHRCDRSRGRAGA